MCATNCLFTKNVFKNSWWGKGLVRAFICLPVFWQCKGSDKIKSYRTLNNECSRSCVTSKVSPATKKDTFHAIIFMKWHWYLCYSQVISPKGGELLVYVSFDYMFQISIGQSHLHDNLNTVSIKKYFTVMGIPGIKIWRSTPSYLYHEGPPYCEAIFLYWYCPDVFFAVLFLFTTTHLLIYSYAGKLQNNYLTLRANDLTGIIGIENSHQHQTIFPVIMLDMIA